MPEGPSIVLLKEALRSFKGKKLIVVNGNAKINYDKLQHKTIRDFKSWGKHLLICFDGCFLRIHLLLFGTYRINEAKEAPPRLHLEFRKGTINFYTCSVQLIEKDPDEVYDWSGDVMNPAWNARKASAKLKVHPDMLVCDALLNQDIFAGVGNIIKNEVLFRIRLHPKSLVGKIPPAIKRALLKQAVQYSFDFLEWKRAFELKKHWLAHNKKICPRCHIPFHKAWLGKTQRRSFFCTNCQLLYK
jgi:endonuclease VIII